MDAHGIDDTTGTRLLGTSRRILIKTAAAGALGGIVAANGGALVADAARVDLLIPNAAGSQTRWRWCFKCQGLFYGPRVASSKCPAGGTHDTSGGRDYTVEYDVPADSHHETGWKICNKCQGLFMPTAVRSGWCPAKGGYDWRDSGNYVLRYDLARQEHWQPHWWWCSRCMGLFFGDNFTSGWCPAGGGHDGTSSRDHSVYQP